MGLDLGKLIKQAAPIAIGAFAPGMMPAGMNPFLASALASGIGGVALGQKPKDALRSALLGGIAGGAMSKFAPGAEQTGIMKVLVHQRLLQQQDRKDLHLKEHQQPQLLLLLLQAQQ